MTFTVWAEGPKNSLLHLSYGWKAKERRFLCGGIAKRPVFEGEIDFPSTDFPLERWSRYGLDHCPGCVQTYADLRRLGLLAEVSEEDMGRILGFFGTKN